MNSKKATIYDYVRMCKKCGDCEDCPISYENNEININCDCFMREHLDEANEIILKWCDEHPAETRQDKFLKMFPNAEVAFGIINICPTKIDTAISCGTEKYYCDQCKKAYWLAEVEE